MPLSDLLKESFATDDLECWQRERTPTPVRAFGVRLTAAGLSIRETTAVLRLLGVDRSHGAVWQWIHRLADSLADPPTATPSRVAVDELAVRINGELHWLYAAIDTDTKLVLGAELFEHRGTDAATAFLRSLDRKHEFTDTVFLVDDYGYLTALARLDLSGRLDYSFRNHIEKWFQTLRMRIDRFHASWVGSRASAQQWLAVFVKYYNRQRPHQALNHRTPAEEVLN
ncbi:IS6 family transposase [Natronoarchaeum mannanilyticum]|uniref:DDE domain-containing protein n=1 Tax=Natronoarchaeum mannanilyticum TaxID=926360 RepID=A0AAV3TDD8_9EURY